MKNSQTFWEGSATCCPPILKKLNELLELLHQSDHTNQGGTVINIYERGSWHVDKQYN